MNVSWLVGKEDLTIAAVLSKTYKKKGISHCNSVRMFDMVKR